MPKFDRVLAGGKAISGGSLAPRSRRGNTNQTDAYWRGGAADVGSFFTIASETLAGTQATITFSSIPATYKHLQIRALIKTADTSVDVRTRFNGATTDYHRHGLFGDTSTVGSNAQASAVFVPLGYATGNAYPLVSVMEILDYASTSKYKTIRCLSGVSLNGSGGIQFFSGAWQSFSAINSITLFPQTGNFSAYTSIALYGIEG